MKNLFIILITFLSFSFSFSQTIKLESKEKNAEVDAKILNGKVYFKISVTNETENSTYVLTKKCSNGQEQFIGSKKGFQNQLNQAVSYSFKDDNPGDYSAQYFLVRITNEGELLSKWEYSGPIISASTN